MKILLKIHYRVNYNESLINIDVWRTVWISLGPKINAPLRETGRIAVNFTSRVFPTPLRESQTEIEEQVCQILLSTSIFR